MALILEIKVTPKSRHVRWIREPSGLVKCFVASPAEGGKANREVIKLLSKALGCSPQQISIVSGHTHRQKRLQVDVDLTEAQVWQRLQVEP